MVEMSPDQSERGGDSPFDLTEVMSRVDGNEELLRELVDIFLEDCPNLLSEINQALQATDPDALTRAAHSLKGAVANFGAHQAAEAALRVEMAGRQGDLGAAQEAFADLSMAIARLAPALKTATGAASN